MSKTQLLELFSKRYKNVKDYYDFRHFFHDYEAPRAFSDR
jgi:hypothetical protein